MRGLAGRLLPRSRARHCGTREDFRIAAGSSSATRRTCRPPGTAIRFDCAGRSRGRAARPRRRSCTGSATPADTAARGSSTATRTRASPSASTRACAARITAGRTTRSGALVGVPGGAAAIDALGRCGTRRCSPCTWREWRGLVFVAFGSPAARARSTARRDRGRTGTAATLGAAALERAAPAGAARRLEAGLRTPARPCRTSPSRDRR